MTRRLLLALLALALALALAACGTDTSSPPVERALPPPAPVTPTMQAQAADPRGDAQRAATDIVRAELRQEAGALVATIELAAPPGAGKARLEVGAYLLADEADDQPVALRAVRAKGRFRFLLGPWDGKGSPVTGTVEGSTVVIRAEGTEQGRWRYVQFYAESGTSDDVLPDASPDGDDLLPLGAG